MKKTSSGAEAVSGERIQKVLAAAGFGSRREIDRRLAEGAIQVNGRVAKPGDRVTPGDQLTIDGRRVTLRQALAEKPEVIVYNKPEGELVTRHDPEGRATVFSRLPRLKGRRWVAVGRLDINSSGVLLFTTDGALANRLMHPSSALEREYMVRILGQLSADEIETVVQRGVQLEDGNARFAALDHVRGSGSNHWYRVVLTEGRNREIRRVFEALGRQVSRLTRIRYGNVLLARRQSIGRHRVLSDEELQQLLVLAGLPPLDKEQAAASVAGARPLKPSGRRRGVRKRPGN